MSWEGRREALKEVMNMSVDGEPKLVISADDDIMQESLGGGWHYRVNSAGMIVNEKPVKDKHSHPGDALSHGLAAILHPDSVEKRKRVDSYSTIFDPFYEERTPRDRVTENWNPYQY
jgi:hypothetical protein